METNKEMALAWQCVEETGTSVFLTGRAGTGKTTFLRRLRRRSSKRIVVVAPTGVAALNAEGVTIHSLFQLPFGAYKPGSGYLEGRFKMGREKQKLLRTMDLLIIDEVSMVRADLLDAVDACLRHFRDRTRPFGGVQLLMIGDLQQLSPVTGDAEWGLVASYYPTPYFFSSQALSQLPYVTIELQRVYRQQDQHFVDLLTAVRDNRITPDVEQALGSRYIPQFTPPQGEDWIHLTTHNRTAQDHNTHALAQLPTPAYTYQANVEREFPASIYPADMLITLKQGAQVMFVKNEPSGLFYNGKIGKVVSLDEEHIRVRCKGDEEDIAVPVMTWENIKYTLDEGTKDIKQQVVGTFRQYPLRLAWAITVHKSQGLTFDHAVLDINASFAHGQVYVALSRCRTLEGLVLQYPLRLNSLLPDAAVDQYMATSLAAARDTEARLPEMCRQYFEAMLREQFTFDRLRSALAYLLRVVDEHLYHLFPDYLTLLRQALPTFDARILSVAQRFQQQLTTLLAAAADYKTDAALRTRTQAAAKYFAQQMIEVVKPVVDKSALSIDNKATERQYTRALTDFVVAYSQSLATLTTCLADGFALHPYLTAKAKATLEDVPTPQPTYKKRERKTTGPKQNTYEATYELYAQGRSPKDIAIARGLTVGTIYSHLGKLIAGGRVHLDDVVPPARQVIFREIWARYEGDEDRYKKIHAALPPGTDYAELRLVIGFDKT